MKLANYEIEKASASKDIRYYLNDVAYVSEHDGKPVMIATDGKILAVCPVEMEDGDTQGFIQTDAIIKARKQGGNVKANGNIQFPDGSTMTRESKDGAKYPDVDRVIPKTESLSETVLTFDAERFYRLARAITLKNKAGIRRIELRFDRTKPEACAIHLTGNDGAIGVLMTCR